MECVILPPSLLGLTVVTNRTVGVSAQASNFTRKFSAASSHRYTLITGPLQSKKKIDVSVRIINLKTMAEL